MKTTLVLLALVSVAAAAPPFGFRPFGTNASSGVNGGPGVTNVNAQVTNVNNGNNQGGVSFNGGLALASNQQVGTNRMYLPEKSWLQVLLLLLFVFQYLRERNYKIRSFKQGAQETVCSFT